MVDELPLLAASGQAAQLFVDRVGAFEVFGPVASSQRDRVVQQHQLTELPCCRIVAKDDQEIAGQRPDLAAIKPPSRCVTPPPERPLPRPDARPGVLSCRSACDA